MTNNGFFNLTRIGLIILIYLVPKDLISKPNIAQNGLQFVLEVDNSNSMGKIDHDNRDLIITKMKNRIHGLGINKYEIQKQGINGIIVNLYNYNNEVVASKIIGARAQLKFQFLAGPSELEHALKVIDSVTIRNNGSDGIKAPIPSVEKDRKILIKESEATQGVLKSTHAIGKNNEIAPFSQYLVRTGERILVLESNRSEVDRILTREDVHAALLNSGLGDYMFLWGNETRTQDSSLYLTLYYLKKAIPELEGDIVKNARGTFESIDTTKGHAIVELAMNEDCSRAFDRITGANIGKNLAFVFDNIVYSAPVIRSKISSGRAQFGDFSIDEANNFALLLQVGAIPSAIRIVEQHRIGSSAATRNE
jgi:SecD/SecF fusion protein